MAPAAKPGTSGPAHRERRGVRQICGSLVTPAGIRVPFPVQIGLRVAVNLFTEARDRVGIVVVQISDYASDTNVAVPQGVRPIDVITLNPINRLLLTWKTLLRSVAAIAAKVFR